MKNDSSSSGKGRSGLTDKKSQVLGKENGKGISWALWSGLGVALAALLVAVVFWWSPGGEPKQGQTLQSIAKDSQEIILAAAQFDDGKARHYSHQLPDGVVVRFFVLKSGDGVIRAALDACDVCWRANKGYKQDGDDMVCLNCGRRFASVKINEVKGGCNPVPLARRVDGGKVHIKLTDLAQGRGYFDFRKAEARQ